MTCKCRSNYLDSDGVPEKVLDVPEYYELKRCDGKPKDQIGVDACIASAVEYLLDKDVLTLSSCCGHGKESPSIVLGGKEDAENAKGMLALIDDRWFKCMYWVIPDGCYDWILVEAGKDW